ncbi:MAG: hypothetical protein K6F75_00660, partial [Butyrivibrio sp.]|nr:hypothetical protein [Butyrivibrio sp.]
TKAPAAVKTKTPATTTAPAVATPVVLGEKKTNDLPAVLGARRASTDDTANIPGRVAAIIIVVLAAAGIVLIGKRKEEE